MRDTTDISVTMDKEANQKREIVFKLWEALNILRSEIRSEDYDVILYLLVLYRKVRKSNPEILSEISDKSSLVKYSLLNVFESDRLIQNQIERKLKRLDNSHIRTIINAFSSVFFDELDKFFPEIFDLLLYRIAFEKGKEMGPNILPREIVQLIKELSNVPVGCNIYNPFAGYASFALLKDKNYIYYGQEIDEDTCSLGRLRLLAYDLNNLSKLECENSLIKWPKEQKFDLVISSPPVGMTLKTTTNQKRSKVTKIEDHLIYKGLDSLNDTGVLIVVVGTNFLNHKSSEELRKYLVCNNFIKTAIHLPEGLLYESGVSRAILILSKPNEIEHKISLVDGTSFMERKTNQQNKLNHRHLLKAIKNNNPSYTKSLPSRRIKNNNYSLHPAKYFHEEYEGTPLREVITMLRLTPSRISGENKVVRGRNLASEVFESKLNIDELEKKPIKKAYKVDQSCLLVNLISSKLSFSYFEYEEEPIFFNNFITPFIIDDESILPTYLIYMLSTDKVKEQYNLLRRGFTVFRLSTDDFLSIKIEIPSLEKQYSKIESINSLYDRIQKLENEKNELVKDVEKTSFDEFASLKHTLGTPRQEILSYSRVLLSYFRDVDVNTYDLVNRDFHNKYKSNLLDVFQSINWNINLISEILEKGENGLILKKHPLKYLSVSTIEELIRGFQNNNYKFNLDYKGFEFSKESARFSVKANETLFLVLIGNLLDNANKHGFNDSSKENKVVLDLDISENNLILIIKNNGLPFPKNYSKSKFIRKFSTNNPKGGEGLGGYDIDRIAKYFGDKDWQLILNDNSLYPVKFLFKFPLKTN